MTSGAAVDNSPCWCWSIYVYSMSPCGIASSAAAAAALDSPHAAAAAGLAVVTAYLFQLCCSCSWAALIPGVLDTSTPLTVAWLVNPNTRPICSRSLAQALNCTWLPQMPHTVSGPIADSALLTYLLRFNQFLQVIAISLRVCSFAIAPHMSCVSMCAHACRAWYTLLDFRTIYIGSSIQLCCFK